LLSRTYCELAEPLAAQLRSLGLAAAHGHEVASERDLISMLEGGMGVAIAPHDRYASPETAGRRQVGARAHRLPVRSCRSAALRPGGASDEAAAGGRLAADP